MTDRDEFAKAALIGLLAGRQNVDAVASDVCPIMKDWTCSQIAEHSYEIADAMLRERDATQDKTGATP